MSPQVTPHAWLVNALHNRLAAALVGRAAVRAHSGIRAAGESLPEPDLAVFPVDADRPDQHPERLWLVIEVADSSRKKDLGPKARLYALTGIPVYWTFDLVKRLVRVHSDPIDGEYRVVQTARLRMHGTSRGSTGKRSASPMRSPSGASDTRSRQPDSSAHRPDRIR